MSIDSEDNEASTTSWSAPFPSAGLTWQALENRAALAAVELAEVRVQGVRFSAAAVGVVLGAQLTGIALLATITALSWDTEYRVAAPLIATLVLAVGTVALGWWCRAGIREWRPFSEVRRQLDKDRELFHAMMADRKGREEDERPGS